jgi:hypothetical protein
MAFSCGEWERVMDANELRSEIERRKKRAEDLKIKDILWSLHNYFRFHNTWKRDDPEYAYPELGGESRFSDTEAHFSIGQRSFALIYRQDRVTSDESFGSRHRSLPESQTAYGTVMLKVDGESVFDFEVTKYTTYYEDGPSFEETLGKVTRFIEGPWVAELADLLKAINTHRESVLSKRRAASGARELENMKKRFGL